jgi:hypothetical protein
MTRWFGRALLAATVLLTAPIPIPINPAAAAPLRSAAKPTEFSNAPDISSRRSNRPTHSHRVSRQTAPPHYYERPYYYTANPYFVPAPYVFGFTPWVW